MDLYHGTTSTVLEQIQRNGLLPQPHPREKGGPLAAIGALRPLRLTWATASFAAAERVARGRADERGGEPVVLLILALPGEWTDCADEVALWEGRLYRGEDEHGVRLWTGATIPAEEIVLMGVDGEDPEWLHSGELY